MNSSGGRDVSALNKGHVTADGIGIEVLAGQDAVVSNFGSAFGGTAGIAVQSGETIKITNTGSVAAGNNLAITAAGPQIDVTNFGLVTGSVQLSGTSAVHNQLGGVFEAISSDFGTGTFINEDGAVVHTARTPGLNEVVTFTGLRSFSNAGTISLVDDDPNHVFEVASFGNGQTYVGKGKGAVAVDVFLGGPGSPADNVFINADVKGKTALVVNNTNPGNGATNKEGIPVVFVEGNVVGNQFYLKDGPIDAGLVAYDLFFTKTGSGFFELRTIPDGHTGSFLLPELTTASQDVFFATSETWFDRSADLRVLLHGGGPGVQMSSSAPADEADGLSFNPAIWARGGGALLNQGDTAGATAYGRSYNFNLNRDLEIMNFESGIDLGKRDFLTDGDILVFGVLGGAIQASLDYDNILRQFSYRWRRGRRLCDLSPWRIVRRHAGQGRLAHARSARGEAASRIRSMTPMSAVASTPAIASAVSTAACSSSRWPRSPWPGRMSRALPKTATLSSSTTIPMFGDGWACASAPAWQLGRVRRSSRSSSAACGARSRARIAPRSPRLARPFRPSPMRPPMSGARCRPA